MSAFLTDLMNSIFTPGPTPSLLLATNATFACLQLLFFVLLLSTYSIHFLILSFLSGGLWWAINWFARELAAAKQKEEKSEQLRAYARKKNMMAPAPSDDTETETEGEKEVKVKSTVREAVKAEAVKKRHSSGGGTEASTEDEWEKVE